MGCTGGCRGCTRFAGCYDAFGCSICARARSMRVDGQTWWGWCSTRSGHGGHERARRDVGVWWDESTGERGIGCSRIGVSGPKRLLSSLFISSSHSTIATISSRASTQGRSEWRLWVVQKQLEGYCRKSQYMRREDGPESRVRTLRLVYGRPSRISQQLRTGEQEQRRGLARDVAS